MCLPLDRAGRAAWHMLAKGGSRAQGPLGLQPDNAAVMLQGAVLLGGCALEVQHSATTSTAAAILCRVQA